MVSGKKAFPHRSRLWAIDRKNEGRSSLTECRDPKWSEQEWLVIGHLYTLTNGTGLLNVLDRRQRRRDHWVQSGDGALAPKFCQGCHGMILSENLMRWCQVNVRSYNFFSKNVAFCPILGYASYFSPISLQKYCTIHLLYLHPPQSPLLGIYKGLKGSFIPF